MNTHRAITAVVAAVTTLCLTSNAFADADKPAEPAPAPRHLFGQAESDVLLNPSLVRIGAGVEYRRGPFEVGGGLSASTYYVAPTGYAAVKPIESLTLRAEYTLYRYVDENDGALTHKASVSSRFEHSFGPVLMRSNLGVAYLRSSGSDEATYYLPDQDTRVKSSDLLITSRAEVLLPLYRGGPETDIRIGPSLQSQWTIGTGLSRQRVAGTIAARAAGQHFVFTNPALVVDVGVNANDPNHRGEAFGQLALRTEF